MASYLAVIYAIFFQPFMKLFFGEHFLLPESMLFVWAFLVFLMVQFENLCNFRSTVGLFDKDRNYIVMSAIVKLIVGIPAIFLFGVTGLLLASLFGWCFIGYGRFNIVFNYVLKSQNKFFYLFRHFYWSILEIGIVFLLYKLFYYWNYNSNFLEIICSLLVVLLLLTIANVILFYRTYEFKNLLFYLEKTIRVVLRKNEI